MRFEYEREPEKVELASVVDDVLGLSGRPNEEIVDNMIDYLMEYYDFQECAVDYNADISELRSGGYYPCNGEIEITISLLEKPIWAFSALIHEMSHKFDDENNITTGRVNNKGPLHLARSSFPNLSGSLLSKKVFSFELNGFEKYFYYTHPKEVFARKKTREVLFSLLKACKIRYKTIEDKSQKAQALRKIKEINKAIQWEKELEGRCKRAKIYGPLCKPFAKIVYNQMGKKLQKQITKNLIDKECHEDLFSWIKSFSIENFHSKASYERLMNIVEATREYQGIDCKVNAYLQNLGVVDDNPKAVFKNMFDMMKDWDKENREFEIKNFYMTELYSAYDRKFIQGIEKNVIDRLDEEECTGKDIEAEVTTSVLPKLKPEKKHAENKKKKEEELCL